MLPKPVPDFRANNPHPRSCGFLRHDVRLLNEPICSVYTSVTHDEQNQWWPSRTSDEPLQVPGKTKDTVYRSDYMREHNEPLHRTTRHESNSSRDAALGPGIITHNNLQYWWLINTHKESREQKLVFLVHHLFIFLK